MKILSRFLTALFVVGLLLASCARRGSPTGGEPDELPPKFLRASPEPFTTNFDAEEIRIYFDEFIKLSNSQQQIIISPPLEANPQYFPLGSPSKYAKITISDTLLKDNTTYAINFGRSIEDNNEGNPLEFFRYVFSTGSYIDSLALAGSVKDAFFKVPDQFITVALYEVDSTYTDSTIYNEIPRYITNTLDSATTFQLENLKAGTYKLVALKDANSNYKFEPKRDKIAFLEDLITIPTDSTYELSLFKEILDLRFERPKQVSKQHLIFGYEGNPADAFLEIISEVPANFEYRLIQDPITDTLHYWFKPFLEEQDSMVFVAKKGDYEDTLVSRIKDQYADSLVVIPLQKGTLPLNKNFSITTNTPFTSVDSTKFSVVDRDTLNVPFTLSTDSIENGFSINFKKQPKTGYQIQILPEGIFDFFGNTNDTLSYKLSTKERSDYGDLILTIDNAEEIPIIVQLTDDKGKVFYELYNPDDNVFKFNLIEPKAYSIKIIKDENANGIWDTGSYLQQRQPEPVIYYPGVIDIRANSEIYQTFSLK